MKQIAVAALAILMFIPAAHADSSPPPPLEVTFTDTFLSDAGPTETLSGSFEWQPGADGYIIPSTAQDSGSGFLGAFGHPCLSPAVNTMLFYGANGAEIDLFTSPQGDTGLTGNFYIYGCYSSADCFGLIGSNAYEFPASETFTVSSIPEPGTWLLLMTGIVALVGLQRRFNERCTAR
jgi:hypothetical protein